MKRIATLFLVALLVPSAAAAQRRDTLSTRATAVRRPPNVTPTPIPACCTITAIVGANVTAQDAATGTRFQFRVTDRAVRRTLAVGIPVWADPAAGRAGLEAGNLCCAIFGAGRPAVGAVAAAPAPRDPAPGVADAPVRGADPVGAERELSQRDRSGRGGVTRLPTDLMGSVAVESPVHGGWEAEMTVTLSKPAPETNPDRRCRGVHVLAESSQPSIAPVPVALCLQPGETTESFKIRTLGVATDTPVTISAHYLDFPARTATLDVLAPTVDRIEVAVATAAGGDTLDAVLHFTGPPPASPPIKAYLGSTDPAVATVPATVTLPPNATTVPFKILIHPVAEDTELRIRASRNPLPSAPPPGGSGAGIKGALAGAQQVAIITTDIKSVEIEVLPAELKSTSIMGGITFPSTVSAILEGQAPEGGAVVQLSSTRPDLVPVPASITIPEGQVQATAEVQTGTPSGDQASVKVTGTYRGVTRSDDFTVQKHDFVVLPTIVIKDPYGNPVTTPQDGQPLTMCATIHLCGGNTQYPDCGNTSLPPTVGLHYDYKTYHPITRTSTGRSGDLTLNVEHQQYIPACMEVGGVDEGGWLEIELFADPTNQIAERKENNNTRSIKITRP
jgi:hypothetical protein